jgi:hypothetical protein
MRKAPVLNAKAPKGARAKYSPVAGQRNAKARRVYERGPGQDTRLLPNERAFLFSVRIHDVLDWDEALGVYRASRGRYRSWERHDFNY